MKALMSPSSLNTGPLDALEMSDMESGAVLNPIWSVEGAGKPSIIADLCQAAISEGRTQCIWISYQRNGRTLAKDIHVRDGIVEGTQKTFHLCSFANHYGWWKRFSIYSAKGVKEVMVTQP